MQSLPLPARAELMARHAVAFLGFSIPISVALDNVLLALVAVLWIAGGDLKRKLATIAANPVAIAALALFAALFAGVLYGVLPLRDGFSYLGKYIDLLFIPIFITLFREAHARSLALRWFCAAMVVTFIAAEVTALGLLNDIPIMPRSATYPGAFKMSITHGLLAAFAAFAFALHAHREQHWPQRLLFSILALVAIKNVFFVAISRTAYLVFVVLALYYCFALFGRRSFLMACLLAAVLFATGYDRSEIFRQRVDTLAVESGDWQPQWASRESVTVRQEWYRHSLDAVLSDPIVGTGTGSFRHAYAQAARDLKAASPPQPHNEYLLIAIQTGLAGLALLLHLFWRQISVAPRLATSLEMHLARGLVITMAVGCLFNSFLLDHTEGLFYAWFTGLLYGGLRSPPSPGADEAR